MRPWPALLCLIGCVKGNPQGDNTFDEQGGSLAIPGCDYSVTTKIGAQTPRQVTTEVFGTDPTPMQIHLGLMADPKTSIVAQWRTVDDTTQASTMRYGVGANLSPDQLTETATGVEFGFRATGTQVYRVHQVHLCNLQAGTTYSYQVGG